MVLRIATRASKLATWQAHYTSQLITARHRGLEVKIIPFTTSGDKIIDRPLHEIEGKSLFIKELEDALLNREADIAVHCVKDYHPAVPDGFSLDVILKRETAADLVLCREPLSCWTDLPQGAVVGTTSQRRIYELRRLRPDFEFRQLRGNIDTRMSRLIRGDYDAIVLAEAGFNRLQLSHHTVFRLTAADMIPAVAQGALGIETRANDDRTFERIHFLNDDRTKALIDAERAFVRGIGGDCKSAIGSFAQYEGKQICLTAFVGNLRTMKELRRTETSDANASEELGIRLAQNFLANGAATLLAPAISESR